MSKCPQRANRSSGSPDSYLAMLKDGKTQREIAEQYGVTHRAIGKALQKLGMPTNSREVLASTPEGCTATDARILREANHRLAIENYELRLRLSKLEASATQAKDTQ